MEIDIDKETQAFEQWFSAGDHNGCGIEIWLAAKRHAAQVAEPSGASVDSVARDAARLDWIEKNARYDPKMGGQHVWWPTSFRNSIKGPTLRAAIDAAMSPTKAGE